MLPVAGLLLPLAVAMPAHVTRTVTLRDIAFSPASVRVHVGDRVRFLWDDGRVAHNVTSTGRHRFASASTRTRGTEAIRFTKPGTYAYRCTIHVGMDGRVVVAR